jgi:6-pyruvoyltetrahydropterin/6-carboxytetrahydropterin synthase
MKIQAVRIIKFDAGHRVVNHESKCRTLHGHEYKAEVFAEGDLDALGRVIDFGVIKEKIGAWIDDNWDHTMIIYSKDNDLEKIKSCEGYKPVFVTDFNPTAENLAAYLLHTVCPEQLKDSGVLVTKIKLWETSNCYVEVNL